MKDPQQKKVQVVIADDSALMRREIKRILESDPSLKVINACHNGEEVIRETKRLNPDVVLLDINMPVMDGLTALQHIMMEHPCPVVILSSLTQEGAIPAYEALELGAVEFVGKPGGTISSNIDEVAKDLIFKVKAAASASVGGIARQRIRAKLRTQKAGQERIGLSTEDGQKSGKKIVVIGQSTGGPNTIFEIVPFLPRDLGVPIVIVQHMPKAFTASFAQRLSEHCSFPFKEAAPGDALQPSHGYVAPGGRHLLFHFKDPDIMVQCSNLPKGTLHIPSVDVSMESLLSIYGSGTIAVLLTGMGSDGANAMRRIRDAGGRTIAESEETAVVFGMPREAIARGGAEFILPSYKIAEKIVHLVKGR